MPPSVGTFQVFVSSVDPVPASLDFTFTTVAGHSLLVLLAGKGQANDNVDFSFTSAVTFNGDSVPLIHSVSDLVRGRMPTCRAYLLQTPDIGEFTLNVTTDVDTSDLSCLIVAAININNTSGFSGKANGNRASASATNGGNNINPNLDADGLVIGMMAARGHNTDPFVQGTNYTLLATGDTGATTPADEDMGYGIQYRIPGFIGNVQFNMSWAISSGFGGVFVELLSIKDITFEQSAFLPSQNVELFDGIGTISFDQSAFLPSQNIELSSALGDIPPSVDEIIVYGSVDEIEVLGSVDEIEVRGHVDEIQVKGQVHG